MMGFSLKSSPRDLHLARHLRDHPVPGRPGSGLSADPSARAEHGHSAPGVSPAMTRLGLCCFPRQGCNLQGPILLQFVASELRCSHSSAVSRQQILLGSLAAALLELALPKYPYPPYTWSDSATAAADFGTPCLPGLPAFGGGRSDHLLQRLSLRGTSLRQTCRRHP